MKGVTLERDTAISFVLIVIVLFVIIFIVYIYIFSYGLPLISSAAYISQLCPDWVTQGCTEESAYILKINVNNKPTNLATLCEDANNVKAGDFPNIYEKCKRSCAGSCPNLTRA